jgi:peptide/nickel transport system permease protein
LHRFYSKLPKFAGRYLPQFALTILLATFIVYCCIYYFAPLTIDNWHKMTDEEKQIEKKRRGLDVSYPGWWLKLFVGDMGISVRDGERVAAKVWHHLSNTLKLTFGSLAISFLVAASIGFWAAFKPGSRLSRSTIFSISVFSCVPIFLLGLFISLLYQRSLRSFPQGSVACLLALLTLGFGDGTISEMAKHLSDSASKLLSEDFMIAVRARNVGIGGHFRRNMLIPILDIVSSRFALLISATVVVEYVFNYKGIGWLTLNSIQTEHGLRDYPVIMATTLVMVTIIALMRLGCGLIHPVVDRRLK